MKLTKRVSCEIPLGNHSGRVHTFLSPSWGRLFTEKEEEDMGDSSGDARTGREGLGVWGRSFGRMVGGCPCGLIEMRLGRRAMGRGRGMGFWLSQSSLFDLQHGRGKDRRPGRPEKFPVEVEFDTEERDALDGGAGGRGRNGSENRAASDGVSCPDDATETGNRRLFWWKCCPKCCHFGSTFGIFVQCLCGFFVKSEPIFANAFRKLERFYK